MWVFVAAHAACAPNYPTDLDAIRREVVVEQISYFTQRRSHAGVCLATSDDFTLSKGSEDLHVFHTELKDFSADFMSRIAQDRIDGDPHFIPASKCVNWLDTEARLASGFMMVLVDNVKFIDPDHATAESDFSLGNGGHHVVFKLARSGHRWKVVSHDVTVEL